MTVVLPKNYHAYQALEKKRVRCISVEEALRQDIRALRIGILNIMPHAETYEYSLLKPLGRSVLQIEPVWLKLKSHTYHSSDQAHLKNLYISFSEAVRRRPLDGLIVTGAPVEEMAFEAVTYWKELQDILTYARLNIVSTLGICWGGLALAKMLNIEKTVYPKKLFGVYSSKKLTDDHPIIGEFDDVFDCPQSRHSGIADSVLEKARDRGEVNLLAHTPKGGYFIFESADSKFMIHLGHLEYNAERLVKEYQRDFEKDRTDVLKPENFDLDCPVNTWRGHRNEFFTQWIRYLYDHADLGGGGKLI